MSRTSSRESHPLEDHQPDDVFRCADMSDEVRAHAPSHNTPSEDKELLIVAQETYEDAFYFAEEPRPQSA